MPPPEAIRPVSSADRIMDAGESSISNLLSGIVGNIQEIIRSEVRLARVEVREHVSKAARSAVMLAAGALTALYAVLFVLLAVTALLALAMPFWGAALLVGVVLLVAGGILFFIGRARWKEFNAVPQQTVNTVKENVEWVRNRMR